MEGLNEQSWGLDQLSRNFAEHGESTLKERSRFRSMKDRCSSN